MGWDLAIWGTLKLTASARTAWEATTITAAHGRDLPDPFGPPRRMPATTVREALDRATSDARKSGELVELTPTEGGLDVAAFVSSRTVLGDHLGFSIASALAAAAATGGTGKITFAGYGTGTSWQLTLKGGRAKMEALGKDLEASAGMRRVLARLEARQREAEEREVETRIAARGGAPPDASALRPLLPPDAGAILDAAFARLARATKADLDSATPRAWIRWRGQVMAPDRILPSSGSRLDALAGSPSLSTEDRGTLLGLVAAFVIAVDEALGTSIALALLDAPVVFTARVGALVALGRARSEPALDAALRYFVGAGLPGSGELPSHAKPEMRNAAAGALCEMDRADVGARVRALLEGSILPSKTVPGSTARGANASLERNQVIQLACGVLRIKNDRGALGLLAAIAEDDTLLTTTWCAAAVAVVALTTPAEHLAALGQKGAEEALARYNVAMKSYDTRTPDFGRKLVKGMRRAGLLPAPPAPRAQRKR